MILSVLIVTGIWTLTKIFIIIPGQEKTSQHESLDSMDTSYWLLPSNMAGMVVTGEHVRNLEVEQYHNIAFWL